MIRLVLFALVCALALPACERVNPPESLLAPPGRTSTTPPADASAAAPAAPGVVKVEWPEALARLSIVEHTRAGALGDYTVIATMPWLTPPRALVQDKAGRDLVVALGDRLGKDGALVTEVTAKAVTVTELKQEPGAPVGLLTVRLEARSPMPEPGPVLPQVTPTPKPAAPPAP